LKKSTIELSTRFAVDPPGRRVHPEPPKHLTPAAKDWFLLLQREYAIEDAGGLALLTCAAESWDRCTSARQAIEKDGGPIIKDTFGQLKPHPAASIERDARAQFISAIKSLNLDLEPLRDAPGRPTQAETWRKK
jgi:phage terminase small subunit